MTFGQSISTCFGKFATFKGRASRSEFWWFYLFLFLLNCSVLIILGVVIGFANPMTDKIGDAVYWGTTLPILAAGSRRLHDIGKSGWWQLIMLTVIGTIPMIYWWCSNTKSDGDKYNL